MTQLSIMTQSCSIERASHRAIRRVVASHSSKARRSWSGTIQNSSSTITVPGTIRGVSCSSTLRVEL
jgi:hypothetical protein